MEKQRPMHRTIAMWSGPRNISTAMMRSWENRPDTVVFDEPLYGHYLYFTGLQHPGADEVIADQGRDWQTAVKTMLSSIPTGKHIHYQKQMTHHLLPHMDMGWFDQVEHCFLIREPREVLASYVQKREQVSLEDIGFCQQADIFERVASNVDTIPPILDAKDVLKNPEAMLKLLCERLDIPFYKEMLSWHAGPRDSDGVWATHWYDSVFQSTGFKQYTNRDIDLSPKLESIAEQARPYYEKLYTLRLRVGT